MSTIAAHVIVAEVRIHITLFPTVRHLISCADLCPPLHESASKALSRLVRKSAPSLKTVFVQCAYAAPTKAPISKPNTIA